MDFNSLSKAHIKLLKKISKHTEIRAEKRTLNDVNYLYELGLVDVCSCDKPDDFFYQATISEKGKAFLESYKRQRSYEKVTRIIAIISLLLSIIATFTPFPEWVQEYIIALLK